MDKDDYEVARYSMASFRLYEPMTLEVSTMVSTISKWRVIGMVDRFVVFEMTRAALAMAAWESRAARSSLLLWLATPAAFVCPLRFDRWLCVCVCVSVCVCVCVGQSVRQCDDQWEGGQR